MPCACKAWSWRVGMQVAELGQHGRAAAAQQDDADQNRRQFAQQDRDQHVAERSPPAPPRAANRSPDRPCRRRPAPPRTPSPSGCRPAPCAARGGTRAAPNGAMTAATAPPHDAGAERHQRQQEAAAGRARHDRPTPTARADCTRADGESRRADGASVTAGPPGQRCATGRRPADRRCRAAGTGSPGAAAHRRRRSPGSAPGAAERAMWSAVSNASPHRLNCCRSRPTRQP